MLGAITDLYLTANVLILLDGSYASRFWTLMEAWCSMMTASTSGVRAATEAERRYTIECIHNASEFHRLGLEDMLSTKTPEEMHEILSKPDVSATNMADKDTQLPKVRKVNDHVKEIMRS